MGLFSKSKPKQTIGNPTNVTATANPTLEPERKAPPPPPPSTLLARGPTPSHNSNVYTIPNPPPLAPAHVKYREKDPMMMVMGMLHHTSGRKGVFRKDLDDLSSKSREELEQMIRTLRAQVEGRRPIEEEQEEDVEEDEPDDAWD